MIIMLMAYYIIIYQKLMLITIVIACIKIQKDLIIKIAVNNYNNNNKKVF